MMLEGRVLAPDEAEELGLVHRVVAPDALAGEAAATAERLGRRAPGTVAALKRAVYDGATRGLAEGLHMERAARDARLGPIGGGTDEIMKEILGKSFGL